MSRTPSDYEMIDFESLHTNTTFDGVDDVAIAKSTPAFVQHYMNHLQRITKPPTQTSLLIESLIEHLCLICNDDKENARKLYKRICEKLHQMNLIQETYAMPEFESMRTQYRNALQQLVSVAQEEDYADELKEEWPIVPKRNFNFMDWSQYHREFDEVRLIAKGGFGKVYRARHKLDGVEYAVKKVRINKSEIDDVFPHISEVKTMASLNHVNIVPYKNAWFEPILTRNKNGRNKSDNVNDSDIINESDIMNQSDMIFEESNNFIDAKENSSNGSDWIQFKDSLSDKFDTQGMDEKVPEEENEVDNEEENEEEQDELEEEEEEDVEAEELIDINETNSRKKINLGTVPYFLKINLVMLHIQMKLCDLTLREWLDKRNEHKSINEFYKTFFIKYRSSSNRLDHNENCLPAVEYLCENNGDTVDGVTDSIDDVDSIFQRNHETGDFIIDNSTDDNQQEHWNIVLDIFQQLIAAFKYIHASNVVHHDTKPSNVFVSIVDDKLLIQLGDFGLACPRKGTFKHTKNFNGTPGYAAPEQLEGICNKKNDIYSLGVILIELLLPFNTYSEREHVMKEIKLGIIPDDIPPLFAQLVKKMLSVNHELRPDAEQLNKLIESFKTDTLKHKLEQACQEVHVLKRKIEFYESSTISHSSSSTTIISNNAISNSEEIFSVGKQITMKNEQLHVRDSELIQSKDNEIESLKQKFQMKELEIHTKDAEIMRLKELLKDCEITNNNKE